MWRDVGATMPVGWAIAHAARAACGCAPVSNLRWLAVGGQSAALFLVHFGLGYPPAADALRGGDRAQRGAQRIADAFAIRRRIASPIARRPLYLAYDVLQLARCSI